MRQTEAARIFGVARGTVCHWMQEYRRGGEAGLDTRPRGRPPAPRLSGEEAETIVELLMQHPPDELGLPFPLWTRESE